MYLNRIEFANSNKNNSQSDMDVHALTETGKSNKSNKESYVVMVVFQIF